MPVTQVITKSELRELRPIFEKFILLNKHIVRSWRWTDVPWRYGERAQIGILALAIFSCGGFPFEEYVIRKRHKRRSNLHYWGRNDLYFRYKSNHYYVEAKYIESRLPPTNAGLNAITHSLERSCSDARKIRRHNIKRLGILFITSKYPRKIHQRGAKVLPALRDNIKQWKKIFSEQDWSATVSLFFIRRTLKYKSARSVRNYYPGITMLAKKV
ncbi:MAG: hypothetical protein ABSA44_12660 [Bacteroidota bacterium]|jgi:hypothetical protein